MGVPKFARFICERYPCIIELLNEYQVKISLSFINILLISM